MESFLLSVSIVLLVAIAPCCGQPADEQQCVDFTHSYCNKFNYSTAIFPNPRGHETPEEAASEFVDFIPLLNRDCHPKLGTLLCFIYFPVCNKGNFDPKKLLVDGFYPCRELCQEVHNSPCTLHVINSPAENWAPHLQCNFNDTATGELFYKSVSSQPFCINGIAPPYHDPNPNECATGTHNCHANADCTDTVAGYNCTCKTGFIGNGRNCSDVDECSDGTHSCSENAKCTNVEGGYTCTCNPGYSSDNGKSCTNVDECLDGTHSCSENAECADTDGSYTCTCNTGYSGDGKSCTAISACEEGECEPCKYRRNAGSKTFKQNCFCYAAHVSVVSSSKDECHYVYTVTINEQFPLKTPYNTTYATTAPALSKNQQITVIANPSHCETECPELNAGQEYIIAGSYSRGEDGEVTWHLVGHNNRALASDWVSKYDRRMSKWVQDANIDRQNNLSCLKQCEK